MEFRIEPTSRLPIYQQLRNQFREAVARGKLRADDRLPSVRELSRHLVVNPNTVARLYTELEREGLLRTQPGLGVFVAEVKSDLARKVRRERLVDAVDGLLVEAVHLGFAAGEVVELVQKRSEQFQWAGEPS